MSGLRSTLSAVVIGGALGAVFMFAALGYFEISPSEVTDTQLEQSDDSVYGQAALESNVTSEDPVDLSDAIYSSRRNAIVRAAEKIEPAVVSLSVIQVVQSRNSSPFGSDFWDFLFLPPPKRERSVLSLGSGVIINPQGYVLTNHHVVEGAKEIRVTLINGDEYPGALVGSDPITDLAVVKIYADSTVKFSNAVLGDSDDLIIGEWAIAVGNPFGYLLDDTKPTVTVGVISATNRDIKPERGQLATYRKMIQTDAAINPGNSGGPLVNALGEVIGINTFIFSSSRGSEGVGFAVPVNRAKLVINDILKFGEVVKAWIGLRVQAITPAIAQSLELKRTRGLIISAVSENSPASKAGLKPGDVPISVGKMEMNSEADWEEIESYARTGRPLGVNILRGEDEHSLVIIPEEIPTRQAPNKTDKFGLKTAEITSSVASYIGVADRHGVLVLGASETAWAARWRLREGDIIRQIGKHKVRDLDDYIGVMEKIGKGYRIVFMIERGGDIFFVQAVT
ncbi:MAG: trypsin-like peptidase domain-containing protein [candidate division Zixibacteria bacterium]